MATSYYYCLRHGTVETDAGCRSADRLGPYETSAEAERALQTAQQKSEAWDHDSRWNDRDED